MAGNRKKRPKTEKPVFDSIRKPVAPPTQKLGDRRPIERIHPAKRGVKYKRPIKDTEDGDL